MSSTPVDPERHLEALMAEFMAQPLQDSTFGELELLLHQSAPQQPDRWAHLAGVYECRIQALGRDDPGRATLLVRLGQLLESRLAAPRAALRRYREARALRPRDPDALAHLRRSLASQGETSEALLVAEEEESLELPPRERARSLAEIASLWSRFGEPRQAQQRLEAALALDPGCDAALRELAQLAAQGGAIDKAIALHERRLAGLTGTERALAQEELAALVPEDDAARRKGLLREALAENPGRRDALEKLIELERHDESWERLDALQEKLFVQMEPDEAIELALGASAEQMERAGSLERALAWADRAAELAWVDARVQRLRAGLLRRAGRVDALCDALEVLRNTEGFEPARARELADLHERAGRAEHAAAHWRELADCNPDDREAWSALDRALDSLGRGVERSEVLERRIALAESPEEAALLRTRQGDLRLELGDGEGAERAYRDALERWPQASGAADRLRSRLRGPERAPELAQLLEQLARNEGRTDAAARHWCDLARVQRELRRDWGAAGRALERALECEGAPHDALAGLRELARDSGDRRFELIACERELETGPAPGRAAELLRESTVAARALGDLPEARAAAERWSALDPGSQAFTELSAICREAGDASGERSALRRLELLCSEQPERRARCLERLGDLALEQPDPDAMEEAVDAYRRALTHDPAPTRELRGKLIDLLRRRGALPELATQMQALLPLLGDRESVDTRLELAQVLAQLEQHAEARRVLEPAFEIAAAHREVAALLERLLVQQGQRDAQVELLRRQLAHGGEIEDSRGLAERLGTLLLDELQRPLEAAQQIAPYADPVRSEPLEALYERALLAADRGETLVEWWLRREHYVEGSQRIELLLQIAARHRLDSRRAEAIAALERADRVAHGPELDRVRRPLLAWIQESDDVATQLEVLGALARDSTDPATRAAFYLERARLQCEAVQSPAAAARDLEQVPTGALLHPRELHLLCHLSRRVGAWREHARALESLLERAPEPREKIRIAGELADLYAEGPDEVRSDRRAEQTLRRLLALDPDAEAALDRLGNLLERQERTPELAAVLSRRLEREPPGGPLREGLVLRLGRAQLRLGEVAGAADLCRIELETHPESHALALLAAEALERSNDRQAEIDFLAERSALCESDPRTRAHWLRRQLAALRADAAEGTRDRERLEVIQTLLSLAPDDESLQSLHAQLLRRAGDSSALATALDASLQLDPGPAPLARRLVLEDLLELYEGPLADPEAALRAIEREFRRADAPLDAELRLRGARHAAALDQPQRELALLAPLTDEGRGGAPPPPAVLRRTALASLRAGEGARAEALLWQVLRSDRGDREALEALRERVERSGPLARQLELLELRFAVEPEAERAAIARRAFELAEQSGDRPGALHWVRRWHALDALPFASLERRLALERSEGSPQGQLETLRALRDAAHSSGVCARLWHQESLLHQQLGHRGLALECLEAAIAQDPEPPLAWLQQQLELQEHAGHLDAQLETLARIATHPQAGNAERRRAAEERVRQLAAQPDQREQACEELQRLLERDPLADPEGRRARLEQLLELCAETDQAALWCQTADQLIPISPDARGLELRRERARRSELPLAAYGEAAAAWEEVLQLDPGDAEALRALVRLHQRSGSDRALAEALERLAQQQTDAEAWSDAARLRLERLGDPERALADVDRALALEPEGLGPQLHCARAIACRRLGRRGAELESLRCALAETIKSAQSSPGARPLIDLPPEELRELWLRLASLRAGPADGREEAAYAAREALRCGAVDADVLHRAREIFERIGDWESTATLLRREIPLGPQERRADLLRQLSRILWEELQRPAEACDALEKLLEEPGARAEDQLRLASALEAEERWPESLALRLRALTERGAAGSAEEWFELAELALAHGPDLGTANSAVAEGCLRDSESTRSWSVRILLHRASGHLSEEQVDTVALAEQLEDAREAAGAFARAAQICVEQGRTEAARELYRRALHSDGSWIPALIGSGELAHAAEEWEEAERSFAMACALLREARELDSPPPTWGDSPSSPRAPRLWETPEFAAPPAERRRLLAQYERLCGESAARRGRGAEALRHLELAREAAPEDLEVLETLASVALEHGAYSRARECTEAQLRACTSPEQSVPLWIRLARSLEGLGECGLALELFERALERSPEDAAARERAVALCERMGAPDRAITHLEEGARRADAETARALELRAARLERGLGRGDAARARLERVFEGEPGFAAATLELAELVRAQDGPAVLVDWSARALPALQDDSARGTLLWMRAEALLELERPAQAAVTARELLALDSSRLDAAELLARNLGHAGDWADSVQALESALATAPAPGALTAQIWEAIGRAYAGPLEDVGRAAEAYRSALAANPKHEPAREALADVTAFGPDTHAESLELHRELLESFPARTRSWRALAQITDHRGQQPQRETCEAVIAAIEGREDSEARCAIPLASTPDPSIAAASEYLRRCEEAGCLPPAEVGSHPSEEGMHPTLRNALRPLAGAAWELPDARLSALWNETRDGPSAGEGARRKRMRLREALSDEERAALEALDPRRWRARIQTQAALRALSLGQLGLRESLLALLRAAPGGASIQTEGLCDLAAVLRDCPAACALLLRIADAVLTPREPGPGPI